ncbi:hypothetical protein B0J13DRAFT_649470 [Dactylonectria estremocensis]|uniref:PDZ-like domain-containing protein n=1 Tax=Dactylonectria estremocensis TaxID=1079267 RepID=A0A9P9II34_9HYPO|nr:hypothetical protein B0J13DRAFT_649470 [Dactylonectria estremocensis]
MQYDSGQYGDGAILSDTPAHEGDTLTFVGYDANKHHLEVPVTVTQVVPISSPVDLETLRYRLTNRDEVVVDKLEPCQRCDHGALLTKDGKVNALWLSHSPEQRNGFAIPASLLLPSINAIHPTNIDAEEDVDAIVVRAGELLSLSVPLMDVKDAEAGRVVQFYGATVQRLPLAVRQQVARLPSEVYVAAVDCGSPAHYWRLPTSAFITHISHQPTPTSDYLVEEVHKIASKTDFTVTIRSLNDSQSVLYLKNDDYFPLKEQIE